MRLKSGEDEVEKQRYSVRKEWWSKKRRRKAVNTTREGG